jgi:hypothetical protein
VRPPSIGSFLGQLASGIDVVPGGVAVGLAFRIGDDQGDGCLTVCCELKLELLQAMLHDVATVRGDLGSQTPGRETQFSFGHVAFPSVLDFRV